ncbi:MAG: riboflavin biosynthesis protein RibF [Tenericutes bacterium GWC2_34_14]|nr:MAG: riboflavin biosynthesis protein RibF [Tenericutes bacterium GWA2_35_7]OHE29527.1 MAG: riboflavin biosynthesis protein RibF [Tenericutes bacterium GWC2_34_14]OHE34623.1 MAG: riboflavin biosynthesis protein RibF [Tenericutes bacterium GWE2_34_108]OHE35980.1 MAG: riboflavin biosynthesis protein RibF [Tenericutes bacterium GWF1_35_14]OHE38934.1 MAG: riboflavin biosynthesis protein RibF [Tenericutes bacterium GWF2_35_184]OHE42586.1 MAG: riboflavin biosynthesis protein RibF [Tenericutes bact
MKIISAPFNLIQNTDPLTITIGNFDGLHLGHQQLIERVLSYQDTKHGVMTFDPHPSSVLRKQSFRTLTQKEDKISLFSKYPLDYAFLVEFNQAFSELSVEAFIEFLRGIHVRRIVIGRDARFAYRGEGTIADLKRYFFVDVVEDLVYNHTRVSTTYIKDFLSTGDLGSARKLLNRHYDVKGVVVHGNKIGHKLGYPTANIDYGNYFLPKSGVYYVKVSFDGETHHAMANIGNNPTLNYSFEKRLEIYILDFKQNIYGKTLDITFMHYLRTELKFRNKKELIEQLQKDETAVRKLII